MAVKERLFLGGGHGEKKVSFKVIILRLGISGSAHAYCSWDPP